MRKQPLDLKRKFKRRFDVFDVEDREPTNNPNINPAAYLHSRTQVVVGTSVPVEKVPVTKHVYLCVPEAYHIFSAVVYASAPPYLDTKLEAPSAYRTLCYMHEILVTRLM
jgi:hypothetical protein